MIISGKIEASALTDIAESHTAIIGAVLSSCSVDAVQIASSMLASISIEP